MKLPRTGSSGSAKTILIVLFLLSLPMVNPWVRGDGVGYYAYVRSLLIDHDLHFENEWLAGNTTFVQPKVDENGKLRPEFFASTGRIDNHFTVGPAILWAPFLLAVHGAVLGLDALGASIPADGYSAPYLITMALATAFYSFLGLWLAFQLARNYFDERWAFLGTLGIWLASSLPVYMYFNPSWSHGHSAFVVALFLWYWHRTREGRSALQWMALGLLAGLMVNVYYPNAVLLLVPLVESLRSYIRRLTGAPDRFAAVGRLLVGNGLFSLAALVALLPTFITRKIIYGSLLTTGYPGVSEWNWTRPVFAEVLFSANHGLLSWTPILALAIVGLFLLIRRDRMLGTCSVIAFLGFYYLISSFLTWHGLSSYGNRFFVSLTPLFVLGLAAFLASLERFSPRAAMPLAAAAVLLLILWNAGLMFQWGTQMIPARGPISLRQAAANQFTVVPGRVFGSLRHYFVARGQMMKGIEQQDADKLRQAPQAQPEKTP